MKRLGLILAASLLVSASIATAGELDAEYGTKPSQPSKPTLSAGIASGELDSESPDQACCWRKRFYGYGFGCHRRYVYSVAYYGGFGYGGFGGGYPGLGYGGYGYGGMGW